MVPCNCVTQLGDWCQVIYATFSVERDNLTWISKKRKLEMTGKCVLYIFMLKVYRSALLHVRSFNLLIGVLIARGAQLKFRLTTVTSQMLFKSVYR